MTALIPRNDTIPQVYSTTWFRSLACKQLIKFQWPQLISANSCAIDPRLAMDYNIVSDDMIEHQERIPDEASIQAAYDTLQRVSERVRNTRMLHFPGFGTVSLPGLGMLQRTVIAIKFTRELTQMRDWLAEESPHEWSTLNTRLEVLDAIDNHSLSSFTAESDDGNQVGIEHIVHFRGDEWLDDQSIDAVLRSFESMYRDRFDGLFFVIPVLHMAAFHREEESRMSFPFSWSWNRQKVLDMHDYADKNPGRQAKVFTVVNIGHRWAPRFTLPSADSRDATTSHRYFKKDYAQANVVDALQESSAPRKDFIKNPIKQSPRSPIDDEVPKDAQEKGFIEPHDARAAFEIAYDIPAATKKVLYDSKMSFRPKYKMVDQKHM
ncbi:hypothetical protein BGZ73_002083 [Actinomortierella ambigua]|nr:hypothetical protein BGZ73_002083 [Actinomortierella ambigua]